MRRIRQPYHRSRPLELWIVVAAWPHPQRYEGCTPSDWHGEKRPEAYCIAVFLFVRVRVPPLQLGRAVSGTSIDGLGAPASVCAKNRNQVPDLLSLLDPRKHCQSKLFASRRSVEVGVECINHVSVERLHGYGKEQSSTCRVTGELATAQLRVLQPGGKRALNRLLSQSGRVRSPPSLWLR